MNNIKEYDEFLAKIEGVKETANFLPDLTSTEGYEKSKRVSLDIGKILTNIEKIRVEIKAPAIQRGKDIDTEAKELVKQFKAMQEPHKLAYKEHDQAIKDREQKRKDDLEIRISDIKNLPDLMSDSSSEEIRQALIGVNANDCEDFYEYTSQAIKVRNATATRLSEMFAAAQKHEKDQAELQQLRDDKAKRDQEDHEAAIIKEATDKAARETKAAEEREEAAKLEAKEAEKRRIADAEQADRDRIQAAKDAEEDAERKAVEAVVAERKRVEAARLEEEEAEKAREKDRKHKTAVNNAAIHALSAMGLPKVHAKAAIKCIAVGAVPGVKISY